ncbi:efflux RND transporter periplasmic adaptor subunit [Nitratireductor sp. OM-1]|uniref:efflux RND transporter periplasmic adaptor subunit n=1 Tax=Nitratireductor sp. OM-1 TaxID=1756988 RepID=UPI000DDEF6BC|nr:efflux RND transporter periplasmic adaptor subunit [Nitratireductor sp. OM-1]
MTIRWKNTLVRAAVMVGCGYLTFHVLTASGEVAKGFKRVQTADLASLTSTFELSSSEVFVVTAQPAVDRLRVSGALELTNRVVVRAKTGGLIVDVALREGEPVKYGDIIARVDSRDLEFALAQREADQAVAEAERQLAVQALERIEQLGAKNIVSRERLEIARNALTVSEARLQSLLAQTSLARTALQDAEIRSPINGVVSRRHVNVGSQVGRDAEIFEIVDTGSLEVRVLVATRDIARISAGQTVELRVDGLEERPVMGEVVRLNPVATENARVVSVFIRLLSRDDRLRGGMFVTGAVLLRQVQDAIFVPSLAVRTDDEGDYVLKVTDNRLLRQPVSKGPIWKGRQMAEIVRGLVPGDVIVTVPLPELEPGVAVTFVAEAA